MECDRTLNVAIVKESGGLRLALPLGAVSSQCDLTSKAWLWVEAGIVE